MVKYCIFGGILGLITISGAIKVYESIQQEKPREHYYTRHQLPPDDRIQMLYDSYPSEEPSSDHSTTDE